jgi:hypothetical protein
MDFVFEKLVTKMTKFVQTRSEDAADEVFRTALALFYYWVNFAPISRGTSATGYMALYASVLATEKQIVNRVPKAKQLDWEALLRDDPLEFVDVIHDWFQEKKPTSIPSSWLDGTDDSHSVSEIIDTTRDMINALNLEI